MTKSGMSSYTRTFLTACESSSGVLNCPKNISINAVPGKGFETDRFEWLFHPAYDTGILMCRAMMEFLGIGYRVHRMFQKREPPIDRVDDVCLLDFGIQFITVADATAGGSTTRNGPAQPSRRTRLSLHS